jgi:hypothetical protein
MIPAPDLLIGLTGYKHEAYGSPVKMYTIFDIANSLSHI